MTRKPVYQGDSVPSSAAKDILEVTAKKVITNIDMAWRI